MQFEKPTTPSADHIRELKKVEMNKIRENAREKALNANNLVLSTEILVFLLLISLIMSGVSVGTLLVFVLVDFFISGLDGLFVPDDEVGEPKRIHVQVPVKVLLHLKFQEAKNYCKDKRKCLWKLVR
jgi:hypothetical protein